MRDLRNPFRIRTSEHIEFDSTFLRLFGPGVLDLLPKNYLWDRIQIFQSAPGGGKTSLFRVFTPSALLTLYESRATNEEYKDLYKRLEGLGVVSESGVHVLAGLLSCARNYATLEDLDCDSTRKERLLYALLNSRITLAMLRGALALKKLNYPRDLHLLSIIAPPHVEAPVQIPVPASGEELANWARSVEEAVCRTLDSFGPSPGDNLQGHDNLYALSVVSPERILFEGEPVAEKAIVMLDDFHKLTEGQRKKVFDTLLNARAPVGVWVAQRLEALSRQDLFSGATTGREYGKTVDLERFWRSGGNAKRFENAIADIADKRAKLSSDTQVTSFQEYLQDSLDGSEWRSRFQGAFEVIATRIHSKVQNTVKYDDWIRNVEASGGTPRQRAIAWRALEIRIERDMGRKQLSFDWNMLSPDQLEARDSSDVRAAAELYTSQEFNIPYYFGMSRLAKLASSNIEQFVAFAGDLYEEMLAAALLKRSVLALEPNRQESILKKAIYQRWEEIPRRVPNGQQVQKFLGAIGDLGIWYWKKGTASYGGGGGITGISISEADRLRLMDPQTYRTHPEYELLSRVLFAAISQNLLEVHVGRKQGSRGETWMVIYLNRWMCMYFGLPLQYGGWKSKSLDELCRWLEQGFRPPRNDGDLL